MLSSELHRHQGGMWASAESLDTETPFHQDLCVADERWGQHGEASCQEFRAWGAHWLGASRRRERGC